MTTYSGPWVWHVDLDQFIAAVEVRRHPELAGVPLIVGGRGDPTERGVVSTASYEARAFGVGSGMPLRVAVRKCPDATFLPVDKPAYDAASAEVMEALRAQRPVGSAVVVQVLGWDEAFVALADRTVLVTDPRAVAQHLRAAVRDATGLACSVGIGDNRLRAKIATEFGKPSREHPPGSNTGIGQLTALDWFEVMGDRPTQALWGIGRQTAKRLAGLGIETVRQLADADVEVLADEIGPTMGPWLHRLGRGVDSARVDPSPYVPVAHGREETYQSDLDDWDVVRRELRALAHRVVVDIDAESRPARRVGIKVRFRTFTTLTRSLTLAEPSNDPDLIAGAAETLLDRIESRAPVRLLGVRLEMVPPVEQSSQAGSASLSVIFAPVQRD
jgi:DNA polymerase-4